MPVFLFDMANSYKARDALLLAMGYASYAVYLQSDRWKGIRSRVFRGSSKCYGCSRQAQQVHHREYTRANLEGRSLHGLEPICRECHEAIEFSKSGGKRLIDHANLALEKIRRRTADAAKQRAKHASTALEKPKTPTLPMLAAILEKHGRSHRCSIRDTKATRRADRRRQKHGRHLEQLRADARRRIPAAEARIAQARAATMPTRQPHAPLAARLKGVLAAAT
jgi:hypothetical protein